MLPGMFPSWSGWSTGDPLPTSSSTLATCPRKAAQCSGTFLHESVHSTRAPQNISSRRTPSWPFPAAQCSGVRLLLDTRKGKYGSRVGLMAGICRRLALPLACYATSSRCGTSFLPSFLPSFLLRVYLEQPLQNIFVCHTRVKFSSCKTWVVSRPPPPPQEARRQTPRDQKNFRKRTSGGSLPPRK